MMEIENTSYRGMLVEVIVKSFTDLYLFDVVDNLKEILQERLNSNLKFKTIVSDIVTNDKHTFGHISFDCEDGTIKVIDFTIFLC